MLPFALKVEYKAALHPVAAAAEENKTAWFALILGPGSDPPPARTMSAVNVGEQSAPTSLVAGWEAALCDSDVRRAEAATPSALRVAAGSSCLAR